jgi:hypothetical protein
MNSGDQGKAMTNIILVHWVSFLYLGAMLMIVGSVQWLRSSSLKLGRETHLDNAATNQD